MVGVMVTLTPKCVGDVTLVKRMHIDQTAKSNDLVQLTATGLDKNLFSYKDCSKIIQ